MKPIPPEFAVGKKVYVRGHKREGSRTIASHYPNIEGGVRLDEPVDGIFRSWNIEELVPWKDDDDSLPAK